MGTACPVVVDFTHRSQTRDLLIEALEVPCSLVIGTSGLSEEDLALLSQVAGVRAVVRAANFSRGLLLMARLTDLLAREARTRLASAGARPSPRCQEGSAQRDRTLPRGALGRRPWHRRGARGIGVLRVGDGVSEHTVFAAGAGERIEIAHRVLDRKAFVPSVIDSVRFVHGRSSGLYSLEDVYPPRHRRD